MAVKRVQKEMNWSVDDRERHKAIRETFEDEPTIPELVARGEFDAEDVPLGVFVSLRLLVSKLREMREQSRLSLADLSRRSGMDKAMLSRLENGHVANPGIETICRYASALDKDVEWRIVDCQK